MPARLPELSPSSVTDLSCSKRYHTLRVLGLWPPKKAISAVARGSAFHQVMNTLYAYRHEDGSLDVRDIPALSREAVLRQSWPTGTTTTEEVVRVESLVKTYLASEDPEDAAATIGCETPIGFVYHHNGVALAYIKATLDRVLVRPDEPNVLVVKEYKSSRQSVELREALILLWCARTKWGSAFKYVLEYEWVNGLEGTVERTVITTDMLQGQVKILVNSLLRVLNAEPEPEPGPKCQWCHLKPECQEFAAVSLGEDDDPFG